MAIPFQGQSERTALDCSVVICAYTEDRWDDLTKSITSVQKQSLVASQIIVVVDHNPSLLVRVQAEIPGVITVENQEMQGLSGARNSGIAIAGGSIVAFLDDDAVAATDWLERLAVHYEDPQVMGVGGAIVPVWSEGRPCWFPREFDWVVGCTYQGLPEVISPIRNLIGANMSFRRKLFEEVGKFRCEMGRVGTRPLGCEETEFCIRAHQRRADYILIYDPGARVYHHVPATRARWAYFRARCYSEGLSKAQVSKLVSARDGLAAERAYTLHTLPDGVLRGLADTGHRDLSGLLRSAGISAGLAITTLGYGVGTISNLMARMRRPGLTSGTARGVAIH